MIAIKKYVIRKAHSHTKTGIYVENPKVGGNTMGPKSEKKAGYKSFLTTLLWIHTPALKFLPNPHKSPPVPIS